MEIKIDPKSSKVQLRLDESHIVQDRKIRDMLKSEGWNILHGYYEIAREQILEIGKEGIRTRAKRELSSEKWAILKGFDEFLVIPQRILVRLKEYDEEISKKEMQERADNEINAANEETDHQFEVVE